MPPVTGAFIFPPLDTLTMQVSPRRLLRPLLPFAAIFGLVQPSLAQTPVAIPAAPAVKPEPWLYKGSDIPPDPAWTFGVLPNGVRYAVRKSGVPPRQVAIRVAMEAGSLMESDAERGYAHYIEHLSFRGSRHVTDGEAKRVWQRLGATFGSDTNAATTPTQTIYKLDLPAATREGLDESLKILSGMMEGPTMTQAEVDAERRTVLAEAREQFGPQVRVRDASQQLFFAGQLISDRAPIGTVESLNAATPASLRAFHDRWYRPERAIVVISGDGDPALFEQLVVKHFSAWRGNGPSVPDPDLGKPMPGKDNAVVVVEPGLPTIVSTATLRPWVQKNDTIVYNQGKLVDLVALRLINRRLEERARAGGSFLSAQVDQEDVSRSVDGTFTQIVPLDGDWQAALRDVRAVIADAQANPSTQAEIDREANEFFSALQIGVETERAEAATKQADDIIEAVNIRETVATAQVAYDVFASVKDKITPAMILDSTKRLFQGVGPRALLTTPVAVANGDALLAQAVTQPVTALARNGAGKAVSFKDLPSLGKPGAVVTRTPIQGLDMERIDFTNGVKMILFPNPAEQGKVYVHVRFGDGLKALPPDRPTAAWAGPAALVASGIGPFDQNALDRLTSGRQINLDLDINDDAFVLQARTRASDLADQLKIIASQLALPRWDAAPIARTRASFLSGYDTLEAAPQTVLQRDLGGLLHGGDARWVSPDRAQITALTPQAFRTLWEPLLKTGPIEVLVFGDVQADAAIKAVSESFGALPPRTPSVIPAVRATSRGPQPTAKPIVRTHKGPADQALAVIAWELGGGIDGVYEARKLELLSQIFNDRMFDKFRESEGAAYSPNVNSNWPTGMAGGGNFTVSSQVSPAGVDRFFALTEELAADFAAKPVTADELARVATPLRELIARASSGNMFWLNQLAGSTREPRKIAALRSLLSDYEKITPAEIQETAKRWLIPGKAMKLAIVPQGSATTGR